MSRSAASSDTAVTAQDAASLLRSAESILVVSHLRPDGDCLGSAVALIHGLESLGKTVAGYNVTPVNGKWSFLEGVDRIRTRVPEWTPDLTVFVDCGSLERVGGGFVPCGSTLNIDHHQTNSRFAEANWIDLGACAVGEQIHTLLRELNVSLTRPIAEAIYVSIMTDTGSFRYSNTTPKAFRIASELLAAGVRLERVSQAIYEERNPGELAMTARAYGRLTYEFDGFFVWSELRQSDYRDCGGESAEPEGLASDIRGIRGVGISCLFHEMEDGSTRAGLRGKGGIDCSRVAESLGGGGHYNAAGAVVRAGSFEAGRERVLEAVRREVQSCLGSNGR